jgi:hypothetical protein
MNLLPQRLFAIAIAASFASATAQTTHAGPWIDSLLGRRPPAYPVGAPIPLNGQTSAYAPPAGYVPPSYAPYAGNQLGYLNTPNYTSNMPANGYAGNGSGYGYAGNQVLGYGNYGAPVASNAPLFAPGFPQTVPAALPTAAYDTTWARTPVTYYRPVTAFDPRYGTTVTSLQPCTSYQYQAQRSPVIAPRPMLGEYGLQANKWPSITGPGYNPTGLAPNPVYPVAPTYQSIPNGGLTYGGQPNTYAPMASTGVSSGMPASSFPTTTMPYANNVVTGLQTYASNYPTTNAFNPALQNPNYSANVPAVNWSHAQVGSGVVPSAAWMPPAGTCPNGNCTPTASSVPATSSVPAPYIPGATVTPVGPPAYSSTPTNAPYSGQPYNLNPAAPNYPNILPNGQPVLPPNQVLPNQIIPGADPESTVRPGLGRAASSSPTENTIQTQRLPLVAIDRSTDSLNKLANSPNTTNPNAASATLLQPKETNTSNAIGSNLSSNLSQAAPIPATLPTNNDSFRVKPLYAPDDFDTRAKWNPTLLDPEDRTIVERPEGTSDKTEDANRRIRLQDEDSSVVTASATAPKKQDRNVIRLVSDSAVIKKDTKGQRQP